MQRFLLALIFLGGWCFPSLVLAQQPPVVIEWSDGQSPDGVAGLVRSLAAEGRSVVVRPSASGTSSPGASTAEPRPLTVTAPPSVSALFSQGLDRGIEAMTHLPALPSAVSMSFANSQSPLFVVAALVPGLLVLIGGLWVSGAQDRRRQRHLAPDADLLARLGPAMRRLVIDGGILLLAATLFSFSLDWILPTADATRSAASAVGSAAVAAAVYFVVGRLALTPGANGRSLLPIARPHWHFRVLVVYGAYGAVILAVLEWLRAVGAEPALAAGWFMLHGSLITVFKVWWFFTGRREIAALAMMGATGRLRRLLAHALPWLLAASAVGIWSIGRVAAVAPDGPAWGVAAARTQLVVVLAPVLAGMLATVAREASGRLVGPTPNPLQQAIITVSGQLGAACGWIVSLIALAGIWQFFLAGLMSSELAAALRNLLLVGALVLAGWVVWSFLTALFDAYAPRRAATVPGEEDDHEQTTTSRLGTVLPLIRSFVLGAVLGLTLLVVLSRLGVDIAPLLAGFGILGLAISFGSQALVRDIVSGIFFIADDAFRVGEYIDTGRLKGTVERISVRSVQLRHQSGLVHTVPFGQIQSVTNASRDWATVKFNLRLDREADLERTRKLVKKVGQAMQEDGELGPEILLPLKLQGLADVDDSAMIVRLKITTRPARASWVQREALKRVLAALRDAGIPLATNAVLVRSDSADHIASGAAAAG